MCEMYVSKSNRTEEDIGCSLIILPFINVSAFSVATFVNSFVLVVSSILFLFTIVPFLTSINASSSNIYGLSVCGVVNL